PTRHPARTATGAGRPHAWRPHRRRRARRRWSMLRTPWGEAHWRRGWLPTWSRLSISCDSHLLLASNGSGLRVRSLARALDRNVLAEGGSDAVEEDRNDDHCQAGSDGERDIELADAADDCATEAAGADHAGEDDHRQGEHDHLVDAGHDGGHRQRDLDLRQNVTRTGAEGLTGLDDLGVDLANGEFGQPHARRQG